MMEVLVVGAVEVVVLMVGLKEVRVVVVDGWDTNAKAPRSWTNATRARKVRFIIF